MPGLNRFWVNLPFPPAPSPYVQWYWVEVCPDPPLIDAWWPRCSGPRIFSGCPWDTQVLSTAIVLHQPRCIDCYSYHLWNWLRGIRTAIHISILVSRVSHRIVHWYGGSRSCAGRGEVDFTVTKFWARIDWSSVTLVWSRCSLHSIALTTATWRCTELCRPHTS